MKFQTCLLLAATCCLLAAMGGLFPVETPLQATPTIEGQVLTYEMPDLASSIAATEFDTSTPPEVPDLAEPESPDTKSAESKSCPAGSSGKSASSGASCHRDFKLFDGDGYLFDRRAQGAARGDGEGLFPRLRARRQAAAAGECVPFQPIRNFFRRRN